MSDETPDERGKITERDDDGRIAREHNDDEIIDAVQKHNPATTGEVAEAVDMSRQGAAYRLEALETDGHIESKSVGPNRVWMPPT
jgi:predicted ArsR family transcriptional regulator